MIKKFDEFVNEGKDRVEIDGNHVIAGESTLPPQIDDKQEQKLDGVDIEAFSDENTGILTDADDHLSQKKVDNLMSPHIKKFNDFGFNPNEKGEFKVTHDKVKDTNEI